MAHYYIVFDGTGGAELKRDLPSPDAARDAAVIELGKYLQAHPEFAYSRHWRVDVKDADRRLLLHVMVATVDAPPPLNFRSFES